MHAGPTFAWFLVLSPFHSDGPFFCQCAASKMSLNSWTSTKSHTFFIILRRCRCRCCCFFQVFFRFAISTHFWFHQRELCSGCLFYWSKCTVCTYCMSSLRWYFFRSLFCEIAIQVLHFIRLLCANTLEKKSRAQNVARSVSSPQQFSRRCYCFCFLFCFRWNFFCFARDSSPFMLVSCAPSLWHGFVSCTHKCYEFFRLLFTMTNEF